MRLHRWVNWGLLSLGVGLILGGLFLPREWYDHLPKAGHVAEPPIKGVTLLQICFVVDGILLFFLARQRWSGAPLGPAERLSGRPGAGAPEATPQRHSGGILLGITLLALILRLYRLGVDLWQDEITTVLNYSSMSVLHVLTAYINSNNHLLNTLLVKMTLAWFGPEEWAIRLPAVFFGTAAIPVVYWLARMALPQRLSLGAALLLAVSYHHIFYSQSARGYTAYLVFSLLATGLLVRGIIANRPVTWAFYILTMVLNFASTLISGFVFAAHLLVGGLALLHVRWQGRPVLPLLRRLVIVMGITSFLGLHLYATILPEVYVYIQYYYTDKDVAHAPFSLEHFWAAVQDLAAGFGPVAVWGGLFFLLIVGIGFFRLLKHRPLLTLALVAPEVLTAVFMLGLKLSFFPRFFLLALPVSFLLVVAGIDGFAQWLTRMWRQDSTLAIKLGGVAVGLLGVLSLISLRGYYSAPKQDFRGAMRYVEAHRAATDIVIPVYLAGWGYVYYGADFGLHMDKDYFPVRSLETLEAVLAQHSSRKSWVVITLSRILRAAYPDLMARIEADWVKVRTFRGTMGDGDTSVWQERAHRITSLRGPGS